MPDFTKLAATAERLVLANGRTVSFVRYDQTSQDVTKPWLGPTSQTATPDLSVDTKATFVEPTSLSKLGIFAMDDSLLKRVEKIMLVAPGATITADLATFNEVIDGAVRWKIEFVHTLQPADAVLLYFVGVKR